MSIKATLPQKNLKLEEQRITRWRAELQPNSDEDRLKEPDYWANIAALVGRGDIIIAIDEGKNVLYEFLVRDGGRGEIGRARSIASVSLLRRVEIAPPVPGDAEALPTGHSIQFLGDTSLWAAMKGSQVMQSGFPSKAAAVKYFDDLARAGVT